jgi:hypothetical protein
MFYLEQYIDSYFCSRIFLSSLFYSIVGYLTTFSAVVIYSGIWQDDWLIGKNLEESNCGLIDINPGILLNKLRKVTKSFSQNSSCTWQVLNRESLEDHSSALLSLMNFIVKHCQANVEGFLIELFAI